MFIKELKDWSNCTGSFKISNSRLVTNSNCQVEENIIELTQTTLIFETQNLLTRYKYTRMWKCRTPQYKTSSRLQTSTTLGNKT